MSIGDLACYSDFWKVMVNPEAEQKYAERMKAICMNGSYPGVEAWLKQMMKDTEKFGDRLMKKAF